MSAAELANDSFELHMVLEGTIESTSNTFQGENSLLTFKLMDMVLLTYLKRFIVIIL